uniref:Uncharacterized protein n=1 Tax=Gopherus agassizii TaxID=38772 RepID=A0A452GH11_9SAUR
MAGVADAAAPGSSGDGRRGGAPEQQQDAGRGEQKSSCSSGESWPPAGGSGQPPQRTETLGFYESDRERKKKRSVSVDVFWNLFVPGCFSLCVHPASFANFSGIVPVHHSALLWLTVSFCFVFKEIKYYYL